MIHDERKMEVFDIVSRRTVGTLDEPFVLAGCRPARSLSRRAGFWRVLDMEGGGSRSNRPRG